MQKRVWIQKISIYYRNQILDLCEYQLSEMNCLWQWVTGSKTQELTIKIQKASILTDKTQRCNKVTLEHKRSGHTDHFLSSSKKRRIELKIHNFTNRLLVKQEWKSLPQATQTTSLLQTAVQTSGNQTISQTPPQQPLYWLGKHFKHTKLKQWTPDYA